MSPVTHFLASWAVAERFGTTRRNRFWITFAGVAPDLDGAGIAIDAFNRLAGRPDSDWFSAGHHVWLHGAAGCLAVVAMAALGGCREIRVLLWMAVTFHLHLLCDVLGSRGPGASDYWPICYWAPFSVAQPFVWRGQWALNSWQNFVITALLIGWAIRQAVVRGFSPVSIFSRRIDETVVNTLRARFTVRERQN